MRRKAFLLTDESTRSFRRQQNRPVRRWLSVSVYRHAAFEDRGGNTRDITDGSAAESDNNGISASIAFSIASRMAVRVPYSLMIRRRRDNKIFNFDA